jgi:hypothetical protein
MTNGVVVGFAIIALIVGIIIFGPLLIIWSLNTLFALSIEYSLSTWFAALVLSGAVSVRVSK